MYLSRKSRSFVTIDQKPATTEADLKSRVDIGTHGRTQSMTSVHDMDTTCLYAIHNIT